jgi:hypothetical protein
VDEDVAKESDSDLGADESPNAADIPPVDFNILVLSLNASALIHLGESGDPRESANIDLPLARNAIDMLCMLEIKTRGNLTGEEERLLDQVLFDLRMRYARHAHR